MRIISFGKTTPALLAGVKTVTRRDWVPSHAVGFKRGDQAQAYDKSPRAGGKRVAIIELTRAPYLEATNIIPAEDWGAEGFAYMEDHGLLLDGEEPVDVWNKWIVGVGALWVVRFRLRSVE